MAWTVFSLYLSISHYHSFIQHHRHTNKYLSLSLYLSLYHSLIQHHRHTNEFCTSPLSYLSIALLLINTNKPTMTLLILSLSVAWIICFFNRRRWESFLPEGLLARLYSISIRCKQLAFPAMLRMTLDPLTHRILGNRLTELEKKLKTLEVSGFWSLPGVCVCLC